jgi:hypothetical protein
MIFNTEKNHLRDKKRIIKELLPTKDKINTNSRRGKRFIDFLNMIERFITKGRSGKSFFDIWENRSE